MDADFSIELGREDPVLDFPWSDPEGKLRYSDLKRQPELLPDVQEAKKFPELAEFLRSVNSAISVVESAKCDAWSTSDLAPEEEIFGASHKFVSYVDLVFSRTDHRESFSFHEHFAKRLVELLRRTPETPSAVEVNVRRCRFHGSDEVQEGHYFTVYVTGYGQDEAQARQNWAIGMRLTAHAVLQLSAAGMT
jgi:hypothetical protein